MGNPLKTLSRVRKNELDELRRILAAELKKEDEKQKEIAELINRFNNEKEFVAQNPGICDFGAYTKEYLKTKEKKEQELKEIQSRIEELRDKIADVFKEQKTFDIVDENRKKEQQKIFEQQQQKMLDEIGTNTYIKKHQE